MTEALQKKAVSRKSELIGQTMEEEIFSLNAMVPNLLQELPRIFADSVVGAITGIMGDVTGEALIRSIGEEKLKSPTKVYDSLDSTLLGGSSVLKAAILEEFRVKIHTMYKMTTDRTPDVLE